MTVNKEPVCRQGLQLAFACAHLAPDVFVNQVVLAFVVKDHVNLLGARTTDVRTWDRQTGRQTGRQTDRQAGRGRERNSISDDKKKMRGHQYSQTSQQLLDKICIYTSVAIT